MSIQNPYNVNNINLILSDMDGVAFVEKNFYRNLQTAYDFDQEGYQYYKQQLANVTYAQAYQGWAQKFLTGKETDKYYKIVNNREYSKGYKDFLYSAHFNNAKTVLVTSGPDDLAEKAAREIVLNNKRLIDEYYANTLQIIDGKFTGKAFVPVDDKDKSECVMELITENKGHILSIGDGEPDIAIARHAHIVIAYNSQCEELNEMADLVLPKGRLSFARLAFTVEKPELRKTKQMILQRYAHEFNV